MYSRVSGVQKRMQQTQITVPSYAAGSPIRCHIANQPQFQIGPIGVRV
jgi:hypothetical protein